MAFTDHYQASDGTTYNLSWDNEPSQDAIREARSGLESQLEQKRSRAAAAFAGDEKAGRFSSYEGAGARGFIAPLASMTRGVGEAAGIPTLIRGGDDLDLRTAANFPVNPQYGNDVVGKLASSTGSLGGAALPFLIPGAGSVAGPLSLLPQSFDSGYQRAEAAGLPASEVGDYATTNALVQAPIMIAGGRLARNAIAAPLTGRTLGPLAELGVNSLEAGAIGSTSRFATNVTEGPTGYNIDPDRKLSDGVASEGALMFGAAGLLGLPRTGLRYALGVTRPPPAATPTPTPLASTSAFTPEEVARFNALNGGAPPAAAPAEAATPIAPPADASIPLPTQPGFLPPLSGKSASDSAAFLEGVTPTESELTRQLYRSDEDAATTRTAADKRVNAIQRIRDNVAAEAERQRQAAVAAGLAEPAPAPGDPARAAFPQLPGPSDAAAPSAAESAGAIIEAEQAHTAAEDSAHADAARDDASELLRQKYAAAEKATDAQVADAVKTAATTAAATEDVAPATAEALRQKATAKLVESTATPAVVTAPESAKAPAAPPPEPPAAPPVDSNTAASSRSPETPAATAPASPEPPAPVSAPASEAVESASPTAPESAARPALTETPERMSAPPPSAETDVTGNRREAPADAVATGAGSGDPSAEATAGEGDGQLLRMSRADFRTMHDSRDLPGDADAIFDAGVAAGKIIPLDSEGRAITRLNTDPTEAMRSSGEVEADAQPIDELTGGVKTDETVREVAGRPESYGSRTDEDYFYLPQEQGRKIDPKTKKEVPSYVEQIAALPKAKGESESLIKAHEIFEKRRYEVQNKVGGYETRGGVDAVSRVMNAALLKYQRNLREGKSGVNGFDPREPGQILSKMITDFQKGASKRKVNVALDAPVGDEGSARLGDSIADDKTLDPAASLHEKEMSDAARRLQQVQENFGREFPQFDPEQVESVLFRIAKGTEPHTMSADDIEIWDTFDEYANNEFKEPAPGEARPPGRSESEVSSEAPGDIAPENAGDDRAGQSSSEQGAGDAGRGVEGEADAGSETRSANIPDSPGMEEGGEGATGPDWSPGDRVSHGRRAARVRSIDGDTATIRYKGSMKDVAVPLSELSPPSRSRFRIGPRADGADDILSSIIDQGGIESRTQFEKRSGQPYAGGEYNDAPDLKGVHNASVYGGSLSPDQMADQLAADHPEILDQDGRANVNKMWTELDKAIRSRAQAKEDADRSKIQEGQFNRFVRDTSTGKKGEREISARRLNVGDTVKVGGETMKVIAVDPGERGDVTLQDGRKYGRQEIPGDTSIWIEKLRRGPKNSGDYDDPFALDEPASESSTPPPSTGDRVSSTTEPSVLEAQPAFSQPGVEESSTPPASDRVPAGEMADAPARRTPATDESQSRVAESASGDEASGGDTPQPATRESYEAARQKYSQAFKDFSEAQRAFRAKEIDAEQFVAAKRSFEAVKTESDLADQREATRQETEAKLPTLRSNERQGDLLSTQAEDLKLLGEEGTDHGARQTDREQQEREAAENRAMQERDQTDMFGGEESPAAPARTQLSPADTAHLDRALSDSTETFKRLGVEVRDGTDDQLASNGLAVTFDPETEAPVLHVNRSAWAENMDRSQDVLKDPASRRAFVEKAIGEEVEHAAQIAEAYQRYKASGSKEDFGDWFHGDKVDLLNSINEDAAQVSPGNRAVVEGALLDGWNLYFSGDENMPPITAAEALRRIAADPSDTNFRFDSTAELMKFFAGNSQHVAPYMMETMRMLNQIRGHNSRVTTETAFVAMVKKFRTYIDQVLTRLRRVAADPKAFSPALADALRRVQAVRDGQAMPRPTRIDAGRGTGGREVGASVAPVRTRSIAPGATPADIERQAHDEIDTKAPTRGTIAGQAVRGVQRDVGGIFEKAGAAWRDIRNLLAPASAGPDARATADTVRSEVGTAGLAASKYRGQKQLERAMKVFNGMGLNTAAGRKTSLDIMDRIEKGKPQASPELQGFADLMRDMLEDRKAQILALGTGRLTNAIMDYFPHIWEKPEQAGQMYAEQFGNRPLEGPGGFLKERSIDNLVEGVAQGLNPVSWNPAELTLLKVHEMDRYLMAQRIANELSTQQLAQPIATETEAKAWSVVQSKMNRGFALTPEQQRLYNRFSPTHPLTSRLTTTPDAGNVAVRLAGQNYQMPGDAARIIQNYLSPGLQGKAPYDVARKMGAVLNQAQLGFSMFHAGFVLMDTTTSKAALALEQIVNGISRGDLPGAMRGVGSMTKAAIPLYAATETVYRGSKVLQEYSSPGSVGGWTTAMVDALQKGGGRVTMDDFYSSGALKNFKKALSEGNVVGAITRAPLALVEAISHPLMGWAVPRAKLGVFSDLAAEEIARNPHASPEAQRAAFRKIWDTVDNRLGQVVYDNLFWNKVLKDSLMLGVRSVGWNLGTLRELGGGVLDANPLSIAKRIKSGDSVITHQLAYAMALPMLAGITGSMIHYMHTGQAPQDLRDAINPRTGRKNPDGSDERLQLPTYLKDVDAYVKHPVGTVFNKVNPLVSLMQEMYQNKDYYGGEIRNSNDPVMQQIGQELKFVVKAPTPFSITGLNKRHGGGLAAGVESFLGVTPAPADISRTPAENAMVEAIRRQLPSGGKTPEEMERANLRRGMMTSARDGGNIQQQLRDAVAAKQMTPQSAQRLLADSKMDPKLRMFRSLSVDDARRVFDLGSPAEKQLFLTPLRAKEAKAQLPLTTLAVSR